MEQLQVTAVFPAIADENREEFRQLAADALADARGEAGTLQYDWFFSDDGTRCVVREIYADSQAVFVHLGNVGAALGRLVELGGGLELEVFGDPSPELRDAIAAFQPRIYAYAQGK
jgi:quinol monooxygenase YgiN